MPSVKQHSLVLLGSTCVSELGSLGHLDSVFKALCATTTIDTSILLEKSGSAMPLKSVPTGGPRGTQQYILQEEGMTESQPRTGYAVILV